MTQLDDRTLFQKALARSRHYDLDFHTLEQAGILQHLTGEADGTTMGRMLCDLTPEGVELVREFFGFRGIITGSGMNDRRPESSVMMIDWHILPRLIVYWALKQHDIVVQIEAKEEQGLRWRAEIVGYAQEDWQIVKERYDQLEGRRCHVYQKMGTALGGMRNRHFWSGRVE
jgi:hypothetical protein